MLTVQQALLIGSGGLVVLPNYQLKVHIRTMHRMIGLNQDTPEQLKADVEAFAAEVRAMHQGLRERLQSPARFLPPVEIFTEQELVRLKARCDEFDVLLINLGGGPVLREPRPLSYRTGDTIESVLDWDVPIVAFAGEQTPMQALYPFPVKERQKYPRLTVALDAFEVDAALQRLARGTAATAPTA